MQVELKVNDKSVQAEIPEEQLKETGLFEQLKRLGLIEERSQPGYERVKKGDVYYVVNTEDDSMLNITEFNDQTDERCYNKGNYYNDKVIAKNNARADRLLRCLRQWQAQNDRAISAKAWKDGPFCFYNIRYNYWLDTPYVNMDGDRGLNNVYFTSEEKAKEAIKVFEDELLWYFTEYVQRLDEVQNG